MDPGPFFARLAGDAARAYTPAMNGVTYYYAEDSGAEIVVAEGAGRGYPPHVHAEHRVFGRVLSGTAVVETPDGRRVLEAGERFSIPPGTVHSLVILPDGVLETVCIPETASVPYGDPCVQAVAGTLMTRPGEPLSLGDMAALAGYSPWHFLRSFRKYTGMTPHAYQLACRVRFVRRLLRNKKAAVEAAVLAGFADQSHMHKVFIKHHGITPKQFLKQSIPFRR